MEREFAYKAAGTMGRSLVLGSLVIGALAGVALASGSSIGLRFGGPSLNSQNSAGLFTILLGVAAVLLVIGIIVSVRGRSPRKVIVGPARVVVPRSEGSNKYVVIDPRTITRVKVRVSGKQGGAKISYSGGNVSVIAQYFGDRHIFDEFVSLVEAARSGTISAS